MTTYTKGTSVNITAETTSGGSSSSGDQTGGDTGTDLDSKMKTLADKSRSYFNTTDSLSIKDMIHLFENKLNPKLSFSSVSTASLIDSTSNNSTLVQNGSLDKNALPTVYYNVNSSGNAGKVTINVAAKVTYDLGSTIKPWIPRGVSLQSTGSSDTGNYGSLDDHTFSSDGVLHVSGWHCNNQTSSKLYHFIILWDDTLQKELCRVQVINKLRQDVQNVYPNIYGSNYSGYDAYFPCNSINYYTDSLKIISGYTSDPFGNDNRIDWASDTFISGQAGNNTISQSGSVTVTVSLPIQNSPSTSAASVATLPAGERITYDQKIRADGWLWVSYLAYSGVRRYIAIRSLDGSQTKASDTNNYSFPQTSSGTIYDYTSQSADVALDINQSKTSSLLGNSSTIGYKYNAHMTYGNTFTFSFSFYCQDPNTTFGNNSLSIALESSYQFKTTVTLTSVNAEFYPESSSISWLKGSLVPTGSDGTFVPQSQAINTDSSTKTMTITASNSGSYSIGANTTGLLSFNLSLTNSQSSYFIGAAQMEVQINYSDGTNQLLKFFDGDLTSLVVYESQISNQISVSGYFETSSAKVINSFSVILSNSSTLETPDGITKYNSCIIKDVDFEYVTGASLNDSFSDIAGAYTCLADAYRAYFKTTNKYSIDDMIAVLGDSSSGS
jgi:hypothetical protein